MGSEVRLAVYRPQYPAFSHHWGIEFPNGQAQLKRDCGVVARCEQGGAVMAIDRMKDINVFVHVAEAKSFTAAAERIGLSRSAVGKSIVRLEDRLGVRLLQRTTRSVSLTGEGAAFHERCVRLRLDLPVSFGRLHVLPVLNEFIRKWPEISVSASFGDRYVDLIDEGVDLAIRIG